MKNTSVLNIYDAVQDYNFTSQDYFVHMLRFQQLGEIITGRNVLDLGCGQHCNLLKAACMMNHGPQFLHYVGVDYGPIKPWRANNKLIASLVTMYPNCDFTADSNVDFLKQRMWDVWHDEPYTIVCFEVLEHMDFESQCQFVTNLSKLMCASNCEVCFFSTPNFNGRAAKNHISELGADLLEEMLVGSGLQVVDKLGLSAWTKYHNINNIPEQFATPQVESVLGYLDSVLPLPLRKMIWGALIDSAYSNNIRWTLKAHDIARIVRPEDLKYASNRQM